MDNGVTLCSLAYNNGQFIVKSLESVKNQINVKVNHLIIDDGSTDDTVELISNWIQLNNYKCDFIVNKKNQGITKNLNTAISKTSTKYFMGLGDDILLPNKISNDLKKMEALPSDYAVVFSDMYRVNDSYDRIDNVSFLEKSFTNYPNIPSGDVHKQLLKLNFVTAPTAISKTHALKAVGGYDESLYFEDWDMWLRLSEKGYKIYFDNRVETEYLILSTSISGKGLTPKYCQCVLQILYKQFHKKDYSNSLIIDSFIEYSELLHKFKDSKTSYWYKKRKEIDKSISTKMLYLLSKLKLPYKISKYITNFLSKVKVKLSGVK